MPAVSSCPLQPLWDQFAALLPARDDCASAQGRARTDPGRQAVGGRVFPLMDERLRQAAAPHGEGQRRRGPLPRRFVRSAPGSSQHARPHPDTPVYLCDPYAPLHQGPYADNFSCGGFLNDAADTGAQPPARITLRRRPALTAVLPDGSRSPGRCLTRLLGRTFRIIEADVTAECSDGSRIGDRYRLATTLLDHRTDPAERLVSLYHEQVVSRRAAGLARASEQ